MTYLLAATEKSDDCDDPTMAITVYDAIKWLHETVNSVKSSTVQNCFAKAGFMKEEVHTESITEELLHVDNDFLHFDDFLTTCGEDSPADEEPTEEEEEEEEIEPKLKTLSEGVLL